MRSIIITLITLILASAPAEDLTNGKREKSPAENLYYPKMTVIAQITDDGRRYDPVLSFIEDTNGNVFSFWSCDMFIGDEFIAVMNDNGTPEDPADDEFLGVRSWKIDR